MENDPIETDDPLEMCVWHAHERIRAIETEMRGLRQRYASLSHLRDQWRQHERVLQEAQRTRADANEEEGDDEAPTQKVCPSAP